MVIDSTKSETGCFYKVPIKRPHAMNGSALYFQHFRLFIVDLSGLLLYAEIKIPWGKSLEGVYLIYNQ